MRMLDPYPAKALLTAKEVGTMLSMSDDTFRRFVGKEPTFPKPILMGPPGGKNERARLRWRKLDVLVWIIGRPPAQVGAN
jgi:predicted DNA-binding transcriptional regulator AlpA